MSTPSFPAVLVLPWLQVQNANAISSPLTHGFPSMTAFIGLMWALQRKLIQRQIPLRLLRVGVICHHHQEQVNQGYVRSFNLTRNPLTKDGSTPAIVEEGRMHMQVSLVFAVALQAEADFSELLDDTQRDTWARTVGEIVAQMRVAGGSIIPARALPGRKVQPWMAVMAENDAQQRADFRRWRRQWLPGFALIAREDVLPQRLAQLRANAQTDATLLDAWLHAARFNYTAQTCADGTYPADGAVKWADPDRRPGSGWLVPIPVGYAALGPSHAPGTVSHVRDPSTPVRWVESVYGIGEWISPHRLDSLAQLFWWAETDEASGLYHCRNIGHAMLTGEQTSPAPLDDDWEETEDDYVDD